MAEPTDELPVLPEPTVHEDEVWRIEYFTASQMHAFRQEGVATASARISSLLAEVERKTDALDIAEMHAQDLAMTVRILCHRLKKHEPEADIIKRAMDYQQRHKLSSPLRALASSTDGGGMG